MKKWSIQVTETCKAWFVVEAETQADAIRTINEHEEEVSTRLEKWCEGWEYSLVEAEPDEAVDYSANDEEE